MFFEVFGRDFHSLPEFIFALARWELGNVSNNFSIFNLSLTKFCFLAAGGNKAIPEPILKSLFFSEHI